MNEWVSPAAEYLWRNGLSAIPLVLMVTAATRWLPCRPSTKHLLWVMVLGWLVTPPLVPGLPGLADLAAVESRESKVESRKSMVRTADPTAVPASRSTVRPASRSPNRLARVPEAAGPKTNGDLKSSGTDTSALCEGRRAKVEGRKSEVESRRSKNRGRGFGQDGSKVEGLRAYLIREGEAPAEPRTDPGPRLSRSFALPNRVPARLFRHALKASNQTEPQAF